MVREHAALAVVLEGGGQRLIRRHGGIGAILKMMPAEPGFRVVQKIGRGNAATRLPNLGVYGGSTSGSSTGTRHDVGVARLLRHSRAYRLIPSAEHARVLMPENASMSGRPNAVVPGVPATSELAAAEEPGDAPEVIVRVTMPDTVEFLSSFFGSRLSVLRNDPNTEYSTVPVRAPMPAAMCEVL